MKKKITLLALCFMCVSLISCGTKTVETDAPKTEPTSAASNVQTNLPTESVQTETTPSEDTETVIPENTEADKTSQTAADESDETEVTEQTESVSDAVTAEQALDAIKKYCYDNNPDLKNMADSGEYNIYWEVVSNEADEIVVLYRSYTGALIRYYIAPVSGETYVTEFVPGIMDAEQRTEESFNVRDYIA